MRLLLTSAGVRNESLKNALTGMAGKDIRMAFVPTAANVEEGSKGWLIDNLVELRKVGDVDVVDISALPKKIWKLRLGKANVLVFSGGNTFHLMYWLNKSGLSSVLPGMLKTRVYVGISAGSMVTNPSISFSQSKVLYYENLKVKRDMKALGFVDFFIRPHLNSPDFPTVRIPLLEKQDDLLPRINSGVSSTGRA